MKICTECELEKPINEFCKRSKARGGYSSRCKECHSKHSKEYCDKNNEKRANYSKTYRIKNAKQITEYQKDYNNQNSEQRVAYEREYRRLNPTKVAIYKKKYHSKNAKKLAERKRMRYRTDINFKLAQQLRGRLNIALKGNYKTGSAVRDLGCSIKEFKAYMESKWQLGMSWDNWSKIGWNIDHIEPLCNFDLTNYEQLKAACHYTNLQPLWVEDHKLKTAIDLISETRS